MDPSIKPPIEPKTDSRVWIGYANCNDYKQEICNYCSHMLHDAPVSGKDHPRWVQSTVLKYGCMLCGKTKTGANKTEHHLKTVPPFFWELWHRKKTAELRFNDRNFQVGDRLVLYYHGDGAAFSDLYERHSVSAIISGITEFPDALKEGWVMLSLQNLINVIDKQQEENYE